MSRPRLVVNAGALLLGASAFVSPARAVEPSALPEAIWWRSEEPASLGTAPLPAMTGSARTGLRAEWAPLYRGPDGSRYERASRSIFLLSPRRGAWRVAAEINTEWGAVRGGEGIWRVGAERPRSIDGTVGISGRASRFEVAGAAGGGEDGTLGLALAGRATLTPGWAAELGWSLRPRHGHLGVRWKDTEVHAPGRWLEQRVHWRLEGDISHLRFALGQDARDNRRVTPGPGDWLEPELAWRASELRLSTRLAGTSVQARLGHGAGREAMRVRRSGTSYAAVAGPLSNTRAELSVRPAALRLAVRAWAGRWSGEPRGALAMWPFEELGAIAGTRRVATSRAVLAHHGLSIDRDLGGAPGWEAGIAAWSLKPRASYESWQATVLGMGRDDPSSGAASLRSALALGLRLAGAVEWGGIRLRLEGVQWAPVRVERTASPAGGAPSQGGETTPGGGEGKARGGTILRLSIEAGGSRFDGSDSR